jgi:hypothetical protein
MTRSAQQTPGEAACREAVACEVASEELGIRFQRAGFPSALRAVVSQHDELNADLIFSASDDIYTRLLCLRPDGFAVTLPPETPHPTINLLEVEYSSPVSDSKMEEYAELAVFLRHSDSRWRLRLFRFDRWAHIIEMDLVRVWVQYLARSHGLPLAAVLRAKPSPELLRRLD